MEDNHHIAMAGYDIEYHRALCYKGIHPSITNSTSFLLNRIDKMILIKNNNQKITIISTLFELFII